jgi:prepilin peptidase CpaA
MAAHQILWIWAVLVSGAAGWLDWRSRRIPNWLTLSGLVVGLAASGAAMGWRGAQAGLAGTALVLALLLPLVWLRALGAGDWKLMGALGAALGPAQILRVLVAAIFIAGIMAVAQISWQKRWGAALRNLYELVQGFVLLGFRANPRITLDNPAMPSLPFGVAVAGATIFCSWSARV